MKDMNDHGPQGKQDIEVEPMSIEERRQHNHNAPINSLPNELLAHIFGIGVHMEAEGSSDDEEPKETVYIPPTAEAPSDVPLAIESSEGGNNPGDWGVNPQNELAGKATPGSEDDDGGTREDLALVSESPHDPIAKYLGIQVVASHVCSRWRECSLAAPNLWTRISLSEGPPYTKAQEWLMRSKGAPLEISLDFTRDELPTFTGLVRPADTEDALWRREILTRALQVVMPHINRWKELDCHVESSSLVQTLLQELEGKEALVLEKLSLNSIGMPTMVPILGTQNTGPVKLFQGPGAAPKLRSWSMYEVHVDWSASGLCGTSLTSLELAYQRDVHQPTIVQFSAILESSPNLEEITLQDSGPARLPAWAVFVDGHARRPPLDGDPPAIKVQPVLLPRLEKLSLSSFEKPHHINNIIELIQAPGLLKLALADLQPHPNIPDFTDTIWTIASTSGLSATTPWEEVRHALLAPRYPKLEDLSIYRVSSDSLLAHSCIFHTLRSLRRIHIVLEGSESAREAMESIPACLIEPLPEISLPLILMRKDQTWLHHEFGTPCPLLEEFQCSGATRSTLIALARRRNETGRRLRKMGYYARDNLTEHDLGLLYSLVDKLVEREDPDYWGAEDFSDGSDRFGSHMDDYGAYGYNTDGDDDHWGSYDEDDDDGYGNFDGSDYDD